MFRAMIVVLGISVGAAASDFVLTHRLQRGQTMAAVARLYGLPLSHLLQANPGLDPHRLEVGTPLCLPTPVGGWPQYSVTPGDRASALRYPLEVLAVLNPGVDLEHLAVGQSLSVPLTTAVGGPGAPSLAAGDAGNARAGEAGNPPAEAQAASDLAGDSRSPSGTRPAGDWEAVTLADGRRGWAPRAAMLIPSSTPLPPPQVVEMARRFVGAPYLWGGMSPNGVDCSGFVQEVFRLCGHPLPRLADDQFKETSPIDEPSPGDLVFFSTYLPGPSHVGISLGGLDFIHASSSRGVVVSRLDENYFQSRYLGAHRLTTFSLSRSAASGP